MQKLAEICIRRPIFAAMLVLALVVVGAAAYFRLGVDRFPAVDLPTVMVRTSLPGGSGAPNRRGPNGGAADAINRACGSRVRDWPNGI